MTSTVPDARRQRGARAQRLGVAAEQAACRALAAEGWELLGRRLRTPAGEIDLVARHGDLVTFIEVKARPSLGQAASALAPRQARRLLAAAECLLALHPDWGAGDVRFDVLLVDATGAVRRVRDALRAETSE